MFQLIIFICECYYYNIVMVLLKCLESHFKIKAIIFIKDVVCVLLVFS